MNNDVLELEMAAYQLNKLLTITQVDVVEKESTCQMAEAYKNSVGLEGEGNFLTRIRDAIVAAFNWLKEKIVNAYRSISARLKKWAKRNDDLIKDIKATEGDDPKDNVVDLDETSNGSSPLLLSKYIPSESKDVSGLMEVSEKTVDQALDDLDKLLDKDSGVDRKAVDAVLNKAGETIRAEISKNGMVLIERGKDQNTYILSKEKGIEPGISVIEKTDDKGMVSFITEVTQNSQTSFKGEGKSDLIKTAETLGTLIRALDSRIKDHDDKTIQKLEQRAMKLLSKMNQKADKGELDKASLMAMSSATQKLVRVMTDVNVLQSRLSNAEAEIVNKAQKALFALRNNLK